MNEKDSPEGRQAGGRGVVQVGQWEEAGVAKDLGDTWESRRSRRRWSNERYRMSLLLRKNLTPGEDLVDVGCGPGFYVPVYLSTVGPEHTHLVDQSSQMLAHCFSHYPSLKPKNLTQAPIYSLPFPADRFDVVVNCDVLMHIPHYTRALKELFRICHPAGGRVFLRVNLTEGQTYGDLPQGDNPDPGKIYWIAYGRNEFRKALEELGPSSIEVIDRICRKPLKRGGDSFQADAAIVVLTRGRARRALKRGSRLGHLVSKALSLGA